jgi:hypothetical protein
MPINRHLQRSIKIDKSHTIISIEWYAFLDCQNLKSVTIPASVRTIGDISFGCYDYQKRKDGEGYIYTEKCLILWYMEKLVRRQSGSRDEMGL